MKVTTGLLNQIENSWESMPNIGLIVFSNGEEELVTYAPVFTCHWSEGTVANGVSVWKGSR